MELPTALLDAYHATAYVVAAAPCPMVLNIGTRNEAAAQLLQSRGLKSALFISAHNPWSQQLPARQNQSRHWRMVKELSQYGEVLSGFGVSPRGDWPAESGVLVLCDAPRQHERWIKLFAQIAAVRVTADGEVTLMVNPEPIPVVRQSLALNTWPPLKFDGFPAHQRLCFYPSSGSELLWAVMELDADLFVFTDKERRNGNWARIEASFIRNRKPIELLEYGWDYLKFRSGDKTGLLLWEDNNNTIDRLTKAGCKVHHFVGICDGCREGGNLECVHERPFVRRLMRIAADEMHYITDHSEPLQGISLKSVYGAGSIEGFVERALLSDFSQPRHRNFSREPDCYEWSEPDALFQLVSVYGRGVGDWQVQASELLVHSHDQALRTLSKSRENTQLVQYKVEKIYQKFLF